MNQSTTRLSAFILLFIFAIPGRAQRFDTRAIDLFWIVVDRLEQDRPLTDSLWTAYYELPGNKDYMARNRPNDQVTEHRKYLEMVFRPSMRDSLPELRLQKGGPGDDILQNLLYIHDHEAAIRRYTAVVTAKDYLNTCLTLAKRFLPAETNPLPANLVIYIEAMTLDAAVQTPNMYFGISIIYDLDRIQQGTVAAHELHHQLRKSREIGKSISSSDSVSFTMAEQINNEGTADMVDKPITVAHVDSVYDGASLVHWLFDDAPAVIRRLDSAFLVNARAGRGQRPFGYRDARRMMLYSSGHIPGFYMADVIIRNGGQAALIQGCENPFVIFYLYNSYAAKDKERPVLFSDQTIAYLRELEKRVY
jgi:hypothetical protein